MGVCGLALGEHRAVLSLSTTTPPALSSYGCDLGRCRYRTHRLISTV